jgi:hypothetical protein
MRLLFEAIWAKVGGRDTCHGWTMYWPRAHCRLGPAYNPAAPWPVEKGSSPDCVESYSYAPTCPKQWTKVSEVVILSIYSLCIWI